MWIDSNQIFMPLANVLTSKSPSSFSFPTKFYKDLSASFFFVPKTLRARTRMFGILSIKNEPTTFLYSPRVTEDTESAVWSMIWINFCLIR